MRIFLALLVISLGWITQGCTNEADRNAIRQMEQAAPLMLSDPEVAHVLLADSVAHPELLSPEVNARWCLMLCQLADSIGTPLPYVPQMERAYRYVKRHGTIDEQLQAALYLGRTYMDDQDQEAALRPIWTIRTRKPLCGLTPKPCSKVLWKTCRTSRAIFPVIWVMYISFKACTSRLSRNT